MAVRRICVITGSRAEYGLLYWVMREIADDPALQLQIIATHTHLAPAYGMTVHEIEADGFIVDERVETLLATDGPVAIAKSMALATMGVAEALARLQPDIVVVLGDRYELLAAAQAAMVARIPIAHIHGGEASEGQIDEAIRHSISKMALLHFVAAEAYRSRVIQLGEAPDRVFNFGAPGLDHLRRLPLLERDALGRALDVDLSDRYFMVTYHPVTLSDAPSGDTIAALLAALDAFPDVAVVFTGTNADRAGSDISRAIDDYVGRQPGRARCFTSLGRHRYLSALSHCAAVIGNSSSGLHEAPSLKTPTVNIGDRQRGRLKAGSVIDCGEDAEAIRAAIERALSPTFQAGLAAVVSPYGDDGHASHRIKETLKTVSLKGILFKRFHDLPSPS